MILKKRQTCSLSIILYMNIFMYAKSYYQAVALFFFCSNYICCCVKMMINKRKKKHFFSLILLFQMATYKKLDLFSFSEKLTHDVFVFFHTLIYSLFIIRYEKKKIMNWLRLKRSFFFCSVLFFWSIYIFHFIAFKRILSFFSVVLLLIVKNWKITWLFEMEMSLRYCETLIWQGNIIFIQ